MKRVLLIFGLIGLCLGGSPVLGAPFQIHDDLNAPQTYWGGRAIPSVTNEDALGGSSWDVNRMEISFNGTQMTVKVIGSIFTFHPRGTDGDLYLSSKGWQVSGTDPHHMNDIFTSDEGWDFVVSPTGVYRLNFETISMAAGNRTDQAFQGGYGERIGDASSIFDGESITFQFDTLSLGLGGTLGVHFTPLCGNDVVEGEVPLPSVPEPSTVYLLVGGLVGLGLKMRKIVIRS